MKNLIYVLAIAIMGLVACGAPAEKKTCSVECTKECCAVAEEAVSETTDSAEVVAEEAEVDSMATEEVAE